MRESVEEEARRFGIERPKLERYQYEDGGTLVTALTPESEILWANYLRKIGLAKIAFNSLDK